MELTDLSTVVEATEPVVGFLDLASAQAVKGFGSSPACIATTRDLLIVHMEDLTVLQRWHGEFEGTIEGDLHLLESTRQLIARTSNGVLILPFSATAITDEHILKIGESLRVFGHDTAAGGIIAVSHQGACHYISVQPEDADGKKRAVPSLSTSSKRGGKKGSSSSSGSERRCVAASMQGRMVVTAVRGENAGVVEILKGDVTVLDAEQKVVMQPSHTVDVPNDAHVEVFLHNDLHRVSVAWYEQHSTLHWHCYSTFVGEVCFVRDINLVDQEHQPAAKSRSKKEANKVIAKPLGPTQILFTSNDPRSLLTAWDVSYGAPLWTIPVHDASGVELLHVVLPSAFSTSATLLFTNAAGKRLSQCSLHASGGMAVSKKRSRLRDVLGVFRSSAAAAAVAPQTTSKLPKGGLIACLSEQDRETLLAALSEAATTEEKPKKKGEKGEKAKRQRAHTDIPSGIVDSVIAAAVEHADSLSGEDWKLLHSLLQSGQVSSDSFRPLLRSAKASGRLDSVLIALRYLPDLGERDVVHILRHMMAQVDDEQLEGWDYQHAQLVAVKRSSDAGTKKRRRKDEAEKADDDDAHASATAPMTRLRLLRIFVASAIQKNLNVALLTDAFRALPIEEAVIILRILLVFLRSLSTQLAPSSLVTSDDEMSSLIRHELTLQRACRWAEAIVDSNFTALTLTATSDVELQTTVNDLQALIAEVQQETNKTEQAIGLCSYLSGTQNWDTSAQLRSNEEYQLEVMLV